MTAYQSSLARYSGHLHRSCPAMLIGQACLAARNPSGFLVAPPTCFRRFRVRTLNFRDLQYKGVHILPRSPSSLLSTIMLGGSMQSGCSSRVRMLLSLFAISLPLTVLGHEPLSGPRMSLFMRRRQRYKMMLAKNNLYPQTATNQDSDGVSQTHLCRRFRDSLHHCGLSLTILRWVCVYSLYSRGRCSTSTSPPSRSKCSGS